MCVCVESFTREQVKGQIVGACSQCPFTTKGSKFEIEFGMFSNIVEHELWTEVPVFAATGGLSVNARRWSLNEMLWEINLSGEI